MSVRQRKIRSNLINEIESTILTREEKNRFIKSALEHPYITRRKFQERLATISQREKRSLIRKYRIRQKVINEIKQSKISKKEQKKLIDYAEYHPKKALEETRIKNEKIKRAKEKKRIGKISEEEAIQRQKERLEKFIEKYEKLRAKNPNKRIVVHIIDTDDYYTITTAFLNKLLARQGPWITEPVYGYGSDADIEYILFVNKEYEIKVVENEGRPKKKLSNDGGFFKFVNLTDINLAKFQIYTEKQIKGGIYTENCILRSIKLAIYKNKDLTKEEKKNLTSKLINIPCDLTHFPKSSLSKISDFLNVRIALKQPEANQKSKRWYYGKQKIQLNLVLFQGHYFTDLPLKFNAKELSNLKDIDKMSLFKIRKTKARCPTSSLILKMWELGKFRPMTGKEEISILIPEKMHQTPKTFDLSNIVDEQRIFAVNNKRIRYSKNKRRINAQKKPEDIPVVWADFECLVESSEYRKFEMRKIHKAYAFGLAGKDWVKTYWNTQDFGIKNSALVKGLNYLVDELKYKKVIMYFHNLKYDIHFIEPFLNMTSLCRRGSTIYNAKFIYRGMVVELRDSYKMISEALEKFHDIFNLDIQKEMGTPYELFTPETVNAFTVSLDELKKFYKTDEAFANFLHHNKRFIFRENRFKHTSYMDHYLQLDCLVLREGMEKLNNLFKENFDLSIYDFLTISSLVDHYFTIKGAYNYVYEMTGTLQQFCMQTVIGGRCSTRKNMKYKMLDLDDPMQDFDACSLYPSAIFRMKTQTGKAELIRDWDRILKSGYDYIVEINITKINKKQQIPFIDHKTKTGKRVWTDGEKSLGKRIVNKIQLEDLIEFHEIEYDFIQGVFWSKYSKTYSREMKKLYDWRLSTKQKMKTVEKDSAEYIALNFLQSTLKLMMNSSYGKNIMKYIPENYKYVKSTEIDKYIIKNGNNVIKYNKKLNSPKSLVKLYDVTLQHWNRAQVGGNVLAMSKRIMNEVMGIANDNKIKIYYQDTDSMHIQDSKLELLADLYNKKYNRELIGGNMGQFHNDFSFRTPEGELIDKNVHSTDCIILGKKCYIDHLVGTNSKNEKVEGWHIRMKGVGSKALLANMKDLGYNNPLEIYVDLFNDKKIAFDLVKGGAKFEMINGVVITRDSFIREVSF